jgi:hypothetical protein
MRNSVQDSVFEFTDGAIVAVSSHDHPNIVYRRSERRLSALFEKWAFVFPDGQMRSGGTAQWIEFDPEAFPEQDTEQFSSGK